MTLDQANEIARSRGRLEGWDIFEIMGTERYQIQRDDDAGILESDLDADRLAREAGLPLDGDGYLMLEWNRG